jgi:hypothetical protein
MCAGAVPEATPEERSSTVFRSGNERLYEAYNDLHSLAQDFEKPFDAPAILVVGHQTDGKSGGDAAAPGCCSNRLLHPGCQLLERSGSSRNNPLQQAGHQAMRATGIVRRLQPQCRADAEHGQLSCQSLSHHAMPNAAIQQLRNHPCFLPCSPH